MLTTVGVLAVLGVFESHPANEFPRRLNLLRAVGLFVVIGAGSVLTWWPIAPLMKRLFAKMPNLARPHVLPTFLLVTGALFGLFVLHFGVAPIHLAYQVGAMHASYPNCFDMPVFPSRRILQNRTSNRNGWVFNIQCRERCNLRLDVQRHPD